VCADRDTFTRPRLSTTATTTPGAFYSTTTRRRPVSPPPGGGDGRWLQFDGNTWVYYDYSQLDDEYHVRNRHEEFHIRFQTEEPDSLLWFNGNETHNVHVVIQVIFVRWRAVRCSIYRRIVQ
jgi:hypothetical protein